MPINPALGGNYADPSIIRVGEEYYMTHSSYGYVPGLVIWHSRDLRRWRPVSAALTEYIGDVWAPDFAVHEERYYIYFPAARSNWVVTAPSPAGPWSEPVDLGIRGIDPGHTAGPDGKRYLHLSGGYLVELADDGLSVIGEPRHVYDGWVYPEQWEVEAFSLEGPKVTYRDGYYYLTVAEGGTAGPPTSHMAVSSRSRTPWGPWEHSPYNPIVRTRSADERWWSVGHGSLIDSPDGKWYLAYHGYLRGFHTLGRQTLISPFDWTEDGWFRLQASGSEELRNARESGEIRPDCGSGGQQLPNMSYTDDFQSEQLSLYWQCFGSSPCARFRPSGGALRADGAALGSCGSPLLFMPAHERYDVQVEIDISGGAEGRLLLYYNDAAYLGIGVSREGVRHFRSFKSYRAEPVSGDRLFVRIRNDRNIVSFYYSHDGRSWSKYDKMVDVSGMHHNTLGGFLSLRIGLDAAGNGNAAFRSFTYCSADV